MYKTTKGAILENTPRMMIINESYHRCWRLSRLFKSWFQAVGSAHHIKKPKATTSWYQCSLWQTFPANFTDCEPSSVLQSINERNFMSFLCFQRPVFAMSSLLEAFCLRWDPEQWEMVSYYVAYRDAILHGLKDPPATGKVIDGLGLFSSHAENRCSGGGA